MTAPIRILELRCADGSGGGPEKTILFGAAQSDPERFAVSICYIKSVDDDAFDIDRRAAAMGLDFTTIAQRHRFDPRIWSQSRTLVRQKQIDIVHAHDYKTDLLALLLARAEGVIPLSTAHGYSGQSFRERMLYYPIDRRILALFPVVIVVSTLLRDALVRAGAKPDRVRTILNAVDPQNFRKDPALIRTSREKLGYSNGEIVLGAVGRLAPEKRLDLLLHAFATVSRRRRRNNLRLVLAGDGSPKRELELLAEKLGVAQACQFLGHCSNTRELYHGLDLLVQSSDTEGTSNVLLEAMAMEVPIVATSVGGTLDLIDSGVHGIRVPPGNAERLAEAIDTALADPAGSRSRAAAARRRVEQELSFEARMKKVEAIYEELALTRANTANTTEPQRTQRHPAPHPNPQSLSPCSPCLRGEPDRTYRAP